MDVSLGTSAVGALLKPVVSELVHYLKSKVSEPKKLVQKALSSAELGKAAYAVISVKTLWNVEREVSLFEFYYPSRVIFPEAEKAQVINTLGGFPSQRNYVIQGTAGQGKSILLRYLYGQQVFGLDKDKRIPIFVELRRINSEKSLAQLIADDLARLGLPSKLDLLPHYFSSGRVLLLLDGFDELSPDYINSVVTDVEHLAASHPELHIVATARPDSAIQKSPHFRVAKLDPLKPADHRPFLEKVCKDKAQALGILNAIRSNSHDLARVLTTPLLLTLLVLLYRAQSTIPTTLARFYEQLFDVLFFRHDQTKPGFQRARHTSLDESQLKRMFEAFSFQSQIANKLVFSDSEFADCVGDAANLTGIAVSPTGFRKELVKTACLLIEDGPEISFIHKSVAEFYAATFVQRSNADFAREFYSQISEQRLHAAWAGELTFLKDVDPYRYAKHFMVPEILNALCNLEGEDLLDSVRKEEKWISTWLTECSFEIAALEDGSIDITDFQMATSLPYRGFFSGPLMSLAIYPAVHATINEKNRPILRKHVSAFERKKTRLYMHQLNDLVGGEIRTALKESLADFTGRLKADLNSYEKLIQREEAKLQLVPHLSKKLLRRA